MLENAEIPLEALPAADELEWRGLHARYAARLQLDALITSAILAAILLAVQFAPLPIPFPLPFVAAWLLLGVFAAWRLSWPLVSVPRKGYAVRDKDLVYRSGVVWRTVTAVPFNRVQHVETSSTPLDRRFGQAALQLFTAGGSGGDLQIHGLPADVAEKMRVFILRKAGADPEHD